MSTTGRVVEYLTGRGVPGVTVVFRRLSGAALPADSLVTLTDGEGRFRFAAEARGAGEVVGEVLVRPPSPDLPSYVVPDVRLAVSDVRGAGGSLDSYTVQPYVAWVGSVKTRRATASTAFAFARFERTGGPRLVGGDVRTVSLDPNGFFFIEALALDTGTVIGRLLFTSDSLPRPYQVEDVRIPARVIDRRPELDRVLTIGSSLEYALELRYRGSQLPVVDGEVEFRRTGGLPLTTNVVTGRTNEEGRVRLVPAPTTEVPGDVVGDVTVRAAGLRRPYTVRGVRLSTFDSDELRFGGVYLVGFVAQAAGELIFRGTRAPLADADVQFTRTGGLATTPATFTTRSAADGWFGVALAADTTGEVVGDLVVRRTGGAAPQTFRDVRLRARGDDSVAFAGRFAIGQQLSYAGVLVQRATGAPAENWTVTFRRTGGIRLVADTLVSRVLDWGGFGLSPATTEEGTVEGTLVARSPSGDREVAVGTVRLTTFEGDEVRLAGRYSVGPSLLYVGELRRDDTGEVIVGARAEFRRTGGIRTVETTVGESSNQFGRFRMAPTPLESGEVVGDLYVSPAAPLRDTVFRDVRLQTFETDETRLRAVFRLAGPR
ncbi:MAG: hypothetical protein ACXW05_14215 [Gemmatirosa sp.]